MDRALEVIPGLDPALLERVVDRLFELEPSTVAILVAGSYAKGVADESSDLDVQVVTDDEPSVSYRMWFEERRGQAALHVSPSVKSLDGWLAKRAEPQDWALGFPVEHIAVYVWATDEARASLGDPPSTGHPPGDPELEDFVECLAKIQRAASTADWIAVRLWAQGAAVLAPGLLRTLNAATRVRDRRHALEAALSLVVAPEHYREDLLVMLGLVEASDDAVLGASRRLGRELLALLREQKPDVDPQPDISAYLGDGTLERHLGFLE